MKVNVDADKCIGCGSCVAYEPGIFELTEAGFSSVTGDASDEKTISNVIQALEMCPASAISTENE